MAETSKKKKTANKANGKKKSPSTVKKSSTKKNNTVNKKKPTNKTNAKKKSTNTKKKNSKKVTKKIENNIKTNTQPQEVEKTKKENKTNVEHNLLQEIKTIKANLSKKTKTLVEKYKSLSKSYRILIVVGIVCLLIILLEALLFINHRTNANSNSVYHDSYNSISVRDNSIVLVGSSDFKYSKENDYTSNTKGKLIKYDERGNIVFEKKYDKAISSTFNDVKEVSDGYIVVGTGIFSEEEKKNEGREAFIIKYSKDGEIVWEKYYQVLTNTGYNRVIEVSDGYIAIGQSIYANMEIGNHTTGGGIIVKYDRDGNEMWHNNHGGTKSGNFNGIVEVNGDLYIAGKDAADSGNIVKYNRDGEYQWHKNYSYTDSYGLSDIAYLDGSLYVVGSKKVFDHEITEKDDRYTNNTDAVLIKYDLDGNIQFEKTFGGSGYERYNRIISSHNNFYVIGHICSKDAGLKIITDKDDEMTGLVVRYDINGNLLKKEPFGGSNNDNLTGIATDGTSFYIAGYSNSKDGNMTSGKNNGKDYFGRLLKLNSKFKIIYDK